MSSRLILSLRKAADTSEVGRSFASMAHTQNPGGRTPKRTHDMQFAPVPGEATVLTAEADIPPATVLSPTPSGCTRVLPRCPGESSGCGRGDVPRASGSGLRERTDGDRGRL